MRITDLRRQEITAAFQRSLSRENDDEIESISLVELLQVDEMLGNRDVNAGFRLAIRNRIKDLETKESTIEQRHYESKIRALNLVSGIVIGLVIAGVAKLLFG